MDALGGTVLTGAAAFAATNADDLLLLAAFFADRNNRPAAVVLGQYAGIAALFGASVAMALAAAAIPDAALRLLGLLPIAIGVKSLLRPSDAEEKLPQAGRMASVAAVTIANGGDNLAVYVPLFATRSGPELAVIGALFAAMTALWCYAAARLVSQPALGRRLRSQAHRWVPWLLIALGVAILAGA